MAFKKLTTIDASTKFASYEQDGGETGYVSIQDILDLAGGSVPAGTDTQTLRYNGTTLEASSLLRNDGSDITINESGGAGGYPLKVYTSAATGLQILNGAATFNHFINGAGASISAVGSNYFILQADALNNIVLHNNGNIGLGATTLPTYSLQSFKTDGWKFPNGTTAQRPTHAAAVLRWNTDTAGFEYSDGISWNTFGGAADGNGIYDGSGSLTAGPTQVNMAANDSLLFTYATASETTLNITASETAPRINGFVYHDTSGAAASFEFNKDTANITYEGATTTSKVNITDTGLLMQSDLTTNSSDVQLSSRATIEMGNAYAAPFNRSKSYATKSFNADGDRQIIEFSMGVQSSSDIAPAKLFVDNVSELAVIPVNTIWNGTVLITATCINPGASGTVTYGDTSTFNIGVRVKNLNGTVSWIVAPTDIEGPNRDANMAGDSISMTANSIDDSMDITYNRPTGDASDSVYLIHAACRFNQLTIPAA